MAYPYQAEVSHEGLHKYRIVKAQTKYELNQKVRALQDQWDEQWQKKVEREAKIRNDEDSLAYAKEMTQQAEDTQASMDNILLDDLDLHQFSINDFKDFTEYDPAGVKKWIKEGSVDVLKASLESLNSLSSWEPQAIDEVLEALAKRLEIGMGKVGQPLRLAMTGTAMSPGIGDTMLLVGRDRALKRIEKAIAHFSK